jgi:uncharacterized RDD family membrane protein YckC
VSEYSPSQPPGWYYAQGDPAGTQRYWDGSQWVGGPQAAQGGTGLGGYGQPQFAGTATTASYGSRVVAYLIDAVVAIVIAIVFVVLALVLGSANDSLGAIVFLVGVYLVPFLYFLWNNVIRQGSTGQTIGKSQQNIKLVADATGEPPGAGMAFVRYLVVSLLSGVTCGIFGLLDVLWPLWDEQQKRLVDKMFNLNVVTA